MKTLLLVIDMQNAFIQEGGYLEVKGIRNGIDSLRKFISQIKTKDIPVIFTRHCFDPVKNPIEATLFPDRRMEDLRKGAKGWEIFEELGLKKTDQVVDKYRYDAFFKTNLREILQELKIDTLIITGAMTNVCCESTARTAMSHDYNVIFCSDLTFCSEQSTQQNTLKVIQSHFGKVMSTEDILEFLT